MKILWIHPGRAHSEPIPAMLEGLTDNEELIRSSSPEDATELCLAHSPELVIISVGSPAIEEFLCATRIKHEYPNVKVCVVIDTNNDTLLKAAEASGADIVVPENVSPEELTRLFRYSQKHYRIFPKTDSHPPVY